MGMFETHQQSMTTFKAPRLPPLVAYRIPPHLVVHVYRALQNAVPKGNHQDFDAAKYMTKSMHKATQMLFVMQDVEGTPSPQEAIMISFGQGDCVRLYHANRPVSDNGENWFQWVEHTADKLRLQEINLPTTIFLEDIGWMLRAHASRALGMPEHEGDTHLIHRVERFFGDVVFVVRRMLWAEEDSVETYAGY